MKRRIFLIASLCSMIGICKAQVQHEDLWSIESAMELSILKIDLPILKKDTSLIKNAPFLTVTIYSGLHEKDQESSIILEIPEDTEAINNFRKVNPDQISRGMVIDMFDNHTNYYYQERHGPIVHFEKFNVSDRQFRLVYHKHVDEINLILDRNTPTLFLNKIIYDVYQIGQVQKINFAVLTQSDEERDIWFKQINLDEDTFINPNLTVDDWVKSGFQFFDKSIVTPPKIVEVPDEE